MRWLEPPSRACLHHRFQKTVSKHLSRIFKTDIAVNIAGRNTRSWNISFRSQARRGLYPDLPCLRQCMPEVRFSYYRAISQIRIGQRRNTVRNTFVVNLCIVIQNFKLGRRVRHLTQLLLPSLEAVSLSTTGIWDMLSSDTSVVKLPNR